MGTTDSAVDTSARPSSSTAFSVLEEAELTLLCLDHLRQLRRSYPPQTLQSVEGIDANYLTIACWALNRAFVSPDNLTAQHGNDPYTNIASSSNHKQQSVSHMQVTDQHVLLPSLHEMEDELLVRDSDNNTEADQKKEEEDIHQTNYEYNDGHPSNSHRFYRLLGLASGPTVSGPLTMGEIVAAGITGLGARSRIDAEREMIQSPLFLQFVQAVKDRGFFEEDDDIMDHADDKHKVYESRFSKVVAKFRNKLAHKADMEGIVDKTAEMAAQHQQEQRKLKLQLVAEANETVDLTSDAYLDTDIPTPPAYRMRKMFDASTPVSSRGGDVESEVGEPVWTEDNPKDIDEAERLKNQGNGFMQKKEYERAADCYTAALKISPAGPHSHVYFSNRAAALVSLKRFEEAVLDSERSLALKPDYGKAHARLGLTHFLLGNYRQAIEAYTVALKYEPDNKSSKVYLEKAAKKLAEIGAGHALDAQPSFSVVSEWDKGFKTTPKMERSVLHTTPEERDAERFKSKGNGYMSSREYQLAVDAYSKAIELSSDGPQSHVYFSNRAAALCYLERYEEAEEDSLKSLALNPNYGKAHARLGLSRFFMQDYAGAIEAYEAALEKDPDNAASKSYLAKARAKLDLGDQDIARRLSEDPHIRRMTVKAMSNPSNELLDDPEMHSWAKQAMRDPSIQDLVNGSK